MDARAPSEPGFAALATGIGIRQIREIATSPGEFFVIFGFVRWLPS